MKKYLVTGALLLLGAPGVVNAQKNMTLLGSKTYANELNDIWGYVDSLGNEYALVGVTSGVSVVDVTDPADPTEVWWFNGPFSTWRDLKVWNKHCYVTNESSQGVFIIDLSSLPDTTPPATANFTGSSYPFGSAHNIYIDENGVAYILGSNYGVGGAIMLDVNTDPMNPIELGVFNSYYLHDGMARGDTLWGAAINNGFFLAIDVTDKGNPVIMATQNTPGNFTHNCWISDNGDYLFTTDEVSKAYIGAYDVSDLANISEVDRVRSNPGSGVIPHNTHFMNNYLITSYYRDGVTVHDVTYPDNMIEVANYDTYAGSGYGFNGAWGVYPWLPSGNIIVSNIEDGLTIHGVSYVRACYLEGSVTDLFTSNPITNATVTILGSSSGTGTGITGTYRTGVADSGAYNVEFSAPGYISDTLPAAMDNGALTVLDVQLSSLPSFALSGAVVDAGSGNPIPNAQVSIENADFTYDLTSDGSGAFSIPAFYEGSYNVTVGKWGYITDCFNGFAIDTGTGSLSYTLQTGYYDDFSFDFGWTVSGTAASGAWERGEPLGTTYNGDPANPEYDVSGDCSDKAYVTGNTGQGAGDDDVDDGNTVLESPIVNLLNYSDPYVEYFEWFFNDGGWGQANDTLWISISNGTTDVALDTVTVPVGQAAWVFHRHRVIDFLPLSSTMSLVVETSDLASSPHLVEAGIDGFQVYDSVIIATSEIQAAGVEFAVFPNPFSSQLEITYRLDAGTAMDKAIAIRDVAGRVVAYHTLSAASGRLAVGTGLAAGVYVIQLLQGGEALRSLKVVKL